MILRALVAVVLVGFLALTARVLLLSGYLGFFEIATSNAVVGQIFLDLVLALTLIAIWINHDARAKGLSPWPYIAGGALLGVAGPLAYLLRRPKGSSGNEPRWVPPPVLSAALLVAFAAWTTYVVHRHGYLAFVFYAVANEATQLLFVDLALSLILVAVWMVRDARARGGSYLPFLALGFFFGSAGPLLYLATRESTLGTKRAAGLLALGASAFVMTLGSGQADLRTETVRLRDADGRERLLRLAEKHGLSAWKRHETMETIARDVWPGGGPWWPEPEQRFRSQELLGTFTSRVELLDGKAAGEVWGIQAWSPYKKESERSEPAFLTEPDLALSFYLPTLQYFNELPFRLLSATVVREAGKARHRGRRYDLVFVTWEGPEPRADLDQYLLWIDRETGLLAKVRYTVRDALDQMSPGQQRLFRSLVMGTMHYDDYREIDGVQVPFTQTITLPPPELTRYPLQEHYFHRLTLEEALFDTVSRDVLVPDPERGEPADRKPDSE